MTLPLPHALGVWLGVRVWVMVTELDRVLDRVGEPVKVEDPEKVEVTQGVEVRHHPFVTVGLAEGLSVGERV